MDDIEQRDELDAFVASVVPGTILFDIGAHFGIFSLAALHHGGPTARAIAVDASPSATQMIRTQASLNGFNPNRLEIIHAMVGESVGEGEMVSVGVIAGGYFVPPSTAHTPTDRTQMRMTTVDELARQWNLTPTHVKIDVEGAEASVLRGATKTLSQHSPLLHLELHHAMISRSGGDPSAALQLLRELDYSLLDTKGQPIDIKAVLSHSIIRVMAFKTAAAS